MVDQAMKTLGVKINKEITDTCVGGDGLLKRFPDNNLLLTIICKFIIVFIVARCLYANVCK